MQQQQQQVQVGATFITTRTRPIVVAVTATLLLFVLAVPHDYRYDEQLAAELVGNVVCLTILCVAVRAWWLVLRRPIELRLTPAELTVKTRGQKVGEVRAAIMGYGRRYLDPGL